MPIKRYDCRVDSSLMLTRCTGNATAIIVDDDPVWMMMLEAALASMGIETQSADTVVKARCLLTQFTPSIAILDVQLPDGDGTDILLAIRRSNMSTAIAFITGSLDDFPLYKCEGSPPDMLFSKPLDPSAFREWVKKMVEMQGLVWGGYARAG